MRVAVRECDCAGNQRGIKQLITRHDILPFRVDMRSGI
jgi:hypothetical protein